jgi:hypothetical protein
MPPGGIGSTPLNRALGTLLDKRIVAGELPVFLRPPRDRRYWMASSPYVTRGVPSDQLTTWRRSNDRNLDWTLETLAELGAVLLDGSEASDIVELTPLGLAAMRLRLGEAGPGNQVFQIKVTLLETEDSVVWRRLRVSGSIRLDRLHRILQAAMGWEDYHLHVFTSGDDRHGHDEPDLEIQDHHDTALGDLAAGGGPGSSTPTTSATAGTTRSSWRNP